MASTIAVAVTTMAVPFLGALSAAFGFVPLSWAEIATVITIVSSYIIATEAAKAWYFRSWTADLAKAVVTSNSKTASGA